METKARPVILVVDDDPDIRHLHVLMLEDAGFNTRDFGTAAEAAAWLEQGVPDGAVLDLGMADASGLSVIDHLRKHPTLRTIPIVVVTGVPRESDIWEGEEDWGWDVYLSKPVPPEVLVTTIRDLLANPPRSA